MSTNRSREIRENQNIEAAGDDTASNGDHVALNISEEKAGVRHPDRPLAFKESATQEANESIFVVIPAFNEVSTVRAVASRALRYHFPVVVIDDGSSDGTGESLEGLPVTLLRNPVNLGKAASLWRGFQFAMERGATAIVTLDADSEHNPDDICRLVVAWRTNPHSLVIGARKRDWRLMHTLCFIANRTADFWISWAAGYSIQDTQSGFRVYPTSLLQKIRIRHGMGRSFVFESEFLIKASRLGYTSIPIEIGFPSPSGRCRSHFRLVRDTLRITGMLFYQVHRSGFSPIGLYRTLRGRDRRYLPFLLMNLACLGVLWVGYSWTAVWVSAWLYAIRLFAITGFYHRFFSHCSFKTSRGLQFIFAVIGTASVQRGPLWWAANHRYHHQHSDIADDVHSPLQHGLFWSHIGWFTLKANNVTRSELVDDFAKFPELRFLDRFDSAVPLLLAVTLYIAGQVIEQIAPGLETNGIQMLVWGFFVSTVALSHTTFTINSLAHRFGSKRYPTGDESRNNFALALLTWGEGWHNNHHYYPSSARQGFYWWEIDITYYVLVLFSWVGLVWDLKPVPSRVLKANRCD